MTLQKTAALGALVLAAAIALAGCKTTQVVSGPSCGTANWYNVGLEDGIAGYPAEKAETYRACPAFNASIPEDAYFSGWEQGIARFCAPSNGFEIGARGLAKPLTCPKPLKKGFGKGHRQGEKLFRQEAANAETEARIGILENDLRRLRLTTGDRRAIVNDLEKLEKRLRKGVKRVDRLVRDARKRGYILG